MKNVVSKLLFQRFEKKAHLKPSTSALSTTSTTRSQVTRDVESFEWSRSASKDESNWLRHRLRGGEQKNALGLTDPYSHKNVRLSASQIVLARTRKESVQAAVSMLQANVWQNDRVFGRLVRELTQTSPPTLLAGIRISGPVWMTAKGLGFRQQQGNAWVWVLAEDALHDDGMLQTIAVTSNVAVSLRPNVVQARLASWKDRTFEDILVDHRIGKPKQRKIFYMTKPWQEHGKSTLANMVTPALSRPNVWPEGLFDMFFWHEISRRSQLFV